jgi:hypothetical protein
VKPAAAVLGCCLLLSSGCLGNIQVGTPPGAPNCPGPDGRVGDGVILVAQSVPSAQLLPCLRSLPAGWMFHQMEARSGRTRLTVGSNDQDGFHSVTVALQPGCDVASASEVDSDQPGTRRYDRVARVATGHLADRTYLFPGGCITYHFDLHGRGDPPSVDAISAALGLVGRSTVAAAVRDRSHGRLTLDPAGRQ